MCLNGLIPSTVGGLLTARSKAKHSQRWPPNQNNYDNKFNYFNMRHTSTVNSEIQRERKQGNRSRRTEKNESGKEGERSYSGIYKIAAQTTN